MFFGRGGGLSRFFHVNSFPDFFSEVMVGLKTLGFAISGFPRSGWRERDGGGGFNALGGRGGEGDK